ncbi:MAG: ABC transporter permease [Ancalomicrobiaceae bacterium]|nr:ABC transporter permease [Ancalomicrobiaceae bacterium]
MARIRRFNIGTSATLMVIVVILFVFLTATSPVFLTAANLSNLLRQTSINGIIALGMLMVIITAGIDLSVGAVVAIAGIVNALMLQAGVSMLVSIPLTIAIGAAIGMFNGFLVFEVRITPFIASLGTLTIVRGLVMIISGARMVANLPSGFGRIASAEFLGIPSMFIVWMALFVLTAFLLSYTQLGRNFFIIGSSPEVARLSGIRLRPNIYAVYGLCSAYAALAGILLSARLSMGVPTAGISYELDAIAAVVIGGGSLFGAAGSALGAVLGAIIMQTIRNGGNLLGVDPFALEVIIGALILIAVGVDQIRVRRAERG